MCSLHSDNKIKIKHQEKSYKFYLENNAIAVIMMVSLYTYFNSVVRKSLSLIKNWVKSRSNTHFYFIG